MWEPACIANRQSAGVLVQRIKRKDKTEEHRVAGSAFKVTDAPMATFMTCAHVLLDGHMRPRGEFYLVSGIGRPDLAPTNIRVTHVRPEIDAALFVAGPGAKGPPVRFAPYPNVTMGTPVAAIGAALPDQPSLHASGGGELAVQVRLATGFVSVEAIEARIPETLFTLPDLLHYELNMFGYPGISGAPLFIESGQVIGMMRGTKLDRKSNAVAGYCFADRVDELLEFLHHSKVHISQ